MTKRLEKQHETEIQTPNMNDPFCRLSQPVDEHKNLIFSFFLDFTIQWDRSELTDLRPEHRTAENWKNLTLWWIVKWLKFISSSLSLSRICLLLTFISFRAIATAFRVSANICSLSLTHIDSRAFHENSHSFSRRTRRRSQRCVARWLHIGNSRYEHTWTLKLFAWTFSLSSMFGAFLRVFPHKLSENLCLHFHLSHVARHTAQPKTWNDFYCFPSLSRLSSLCFQHFLYNFFRVFFVPAWLSILISSLPCWLVTA